MSMENRPLGLIHQPARFCEIRRGRRTWPGGRPSGSGTPTLHGIGPGGIRGRGRDGDRAHPEPGPHRRRGRHGHLRHPGRARHAGCLHGAGGGAAGPQALYQGPARFPSVCAPRKTSTLVYTATPWRWHVPVCVAAMKNGKHAATEVPAAVTLEECWQLVETSESTGRHCVMMENCCYDRAELMILNMVRKGLLGDLLHAECGLSARSARHQVQRRGRGAVAAGPFGDPQRGPLSDTRAGSGGPVHERQPGATSLPAWFP